MEELRILIAGVWQFLGAEGDALAGQAALDGGEHGLELHLFQDLCAHGGAAKGHGRAAGESVGGDFTGGIEGGVGPGFLHAGQDGLGHGLGVAGAAPINNSSLFHNG